MEKLGHLVSFYGMVLLCELLSSPLKSRSHPLCQSSLNARNEIVSNLVIGAEFCAPLLGFKLTLKLIHGPMRAAFYSKTSLVNILGRETSLERSVDHSNL